MLPSDNACFAPRSATNQLSSRWISLLQTLVQNKDYQMAGLVLHPALPSCPKQRKVAQIGHIMSRTFCHVYIVESACCCVTLKQNVLAKAMSSQANDASRLPVCITPNNKLHLHQPRLTRVLPMKLIKTILVPFCRAAYSSSVSRSKPVNIWPEWGPAGGVHETPISTLPW